MRLVKSGKSAAAAVAAGCVIVLVLAVVGWAWVSGGREPLRQIVVPVPVPESAR